MRHTKIIATVGPASQDFKIIKKLIIAGVNIFRINMSHGAQAEHEKIINNIRQAAQEVNLNIGILIDLQGPKIRIARFKNKKVILHTGDSFILDPNWDLSAGDEKRVGLEYEDLYKDLIADDILLLDDGRIVLQVVEIKNTAIYCQVITGGVLSNNKGVNKKNGGLSADALTEKDKADIEFAVKVKTDFLAVSFVKNARDIANAKAILAKYNYNAAIIAKIERIEAVKNLNNIVKAADGIMVARGDLAVEIGFAVLPGVQKNIIHQARSFDKPVITATQMMESMIENPTPTRAEVSDVANAVIDGTDAVMLSAETAVGKYPEEVILATADICATAERQCVFADSDFRLKRNYSRIDEAIAMAAMFIAKHLPIKAIVSLTESGHTPLLMSRISTGIMVYGVSRKATAVGRMTLYRGVQPILFDDIQLVLTNLEQDNILKSGDQILITRGDITGIAGQSNTLKLITVGEKTCLL